MQPYDIVPNLYNLCATVFNEFILCCFTGVAVCGMVIQYHPLQFHCIPQFGNHCNEVIYSAMDNSIYSNNTIIAPNQSYWCF